MASLDLSYTKKAAPALVILNFDGWPAEVTTAFGIAIWALLIITVVQFGH